MCVYHQQNLRAALFGVLRYGTTIHTTHVKMKNKKAFLSSLLIYCLVSRRCRRRIEHAWMVCKKYNVCSFCFSVTG